MDIELPRSPRPRVSVIVPASFAQPQLLYACLRSLARHGPAAIPYETIVVLNQADEETAEQLQRTVSGIQVARSAVNLGLAGAGNRGRSLAQGEFLVLLHDDAEIEPGWLQALVETANAHPEAGAVGGKVLFPDGRLQNAGMILWRDATTSPPWIGDTPEPNAFDKPRAVDYCGTSSLLVRAFAWDALGGLDERFYPVYYVDVDLGMALRQRGMVVLYQPASLIRHHQGASGTLDFRHFVSGRNRALFLEKWGTALGAHEPPELSPDTIERALARAETFAESCRRKSGETAHPAPTRAAFDPATQEARLREKSVALEEAYAAHAAGLPNQAC